MELIERAKQFMPFDALNGFYSAIREKEFIKDPLSYLADDEKERINIILCGLQPDDNIQIVYYSNGKYIAKVKQVTKVDNLKKRIIFSDESTIRFDLIYDIEVLV